MHRKPFSLSAGAAAVNADDYYENSKSKRPNVGRNRIMAGIGAVVFILLLTLAYFRGALTEDLPPSPDDLVEEPLQPPADVIGEDIGGGGGGGEVVAPVPLPSPSPVPVVYLSSGGGKWLAGAWAGFGDPSPTLGGDAAGVAVNKSGCPYTCLFTHDAALLGEASAVLMELISAPLAGKGEIALSNQVIDWPTLRPNTLLGNFFYVPTQVFPALISDDTIAGRFNFTVGPDHRFAKIIVNKICSWGHPVSDFLKPPPQKTPGRLIAFFSPASIHGKFTPFIRRLLLSLQGDIHSFGESYKNTDLPPEASGKPFQLQNRLDFIGTYKFIFITEDIVQEGWINPLWSQAFLAGTVPIYLGNADIGLYAPGPDSFIDAKDYRTADELAKVVQRIAKLKEPYANFFKWKSQGLSHTFTAHLDNCVYNAECRICAHVRESLAAPAPTPDDGTPVM